MRELTPFTLTLFLLGSAHRVSGLKRVGQLLRAVEDGEDIDVIGRDAVDDAIRSDDQFAQIWIVVFRHDAPDARVVDQVFGTARELIKGAAGVKAVSPLAM